jgi:phosphonate degradation associated HDIG domain protein
MKRNVMSHAGNPSAASAPAIADEIVALFAERGGRHYGEHVTEREHALQCAALAEKAGDPPAVVLASLLHDIGHLLHDLGETIAESGVDARHEELGADWLASRFPAEIVEPVRLHVAAKRYLCGHSARYAAALSAASATSLQLQGGPMSQAERDVFERHPHCQAAIRVRLHDDHGKVAGLATQSIADYRPLIERFATSMASPQV